MQQLSIIGNLGADAQVQSTNGSSFIVFRVACSEKFTTNGQEQSQTTWYSCYYHKSDSQVVQFLTKGTKVFIQGRPRYQIYDSFKHHCKMIDVSISVTNLELCGGSSPASGDGSPSDSPAGGSSDSSSEDSAPF